MKLGELKDGRSAEICSVDLEERLANRLYDMGLIPGTRVKCIRRAPMGDPIVILLRGYELSLRLADANCIEAKLL